MQAPPRLGRILLVDDEQRVLDFVSRALQSEGYEVECTTHSETGYQLAIENEYDLVILDLLMPGSNGVVVLNRLMRRRPDQSVMILSCLTDTRSKVECLGLGADDYLPKPFDLDELLARVNVRIRDKQRQPTTSIQAGALTLDLLSAEVHTPGGTVHLTRRECLVLSELMREGGGVVSKERLLSAVWGYSFDPLSNVVDVYIGRLRSKLPAGSIDTVRSRGYKIHVG